SPDGIYSAIELVAQRVDSSEMIGNCLGVTVIEERQKLLDLLIKLVTDIGHRIGEAGIEPHPRPRHARPRALFDQAAQQRRPRLDFRAAGFGAGLPTPLWRRGVVVLRRS